MYGSSLTVNMEYHRFLILNLVFKGKEGKYSV